MIIFDYPRCIKYQKNHPTRHIVACYFLVIFNKQIKIIMNLYKKGTVTTEPNGNEISEIGGVGLESLYFGRSSVSNIELDSQNHPISELEETDSLPEIPNKEHTLTTVREEEAPTQPVRSKHRPFLNSIIGRSTSSNVINTGGARHSSVASKLSASSAQLDVSTEEDDTIQNNTPERDTNEECSNNVTYNRFVRFVKDLSASDRSIDSS